MLTKRQLNIFLELCEKVGEYYKTDYFSDKSNISLRTIQNDIKAVKEDTAPLSDIFIIDSRVPFGTRVKIPDRERFAHYLNNLKMQLDEYNISYRDDRTYKLLNFLLSQRRSISLIKCVDYIYVSKSTLTSDLKELEKILSKFSLRLIQTEGYIWIDGLEQDKRIRLIDASYAYHPMISSKLVSDTRAVHAKLIRKTLMKELLEKQYPISDVEFQNIIIWLNIFIRRITNFFYLNDKDINGEGTYDTEIKIAGNIFERIETKYLIRVPQIEINLLATYINNHSNLNDTDYISEDLNTFILYTLQRIHESYPTDFTHDVNLRIPLAPHCVPLISRARNNVQIKNGTLDYIKQSFPYAFGIVTHFFYLLSKCYTCKIKESETAFLTIYSNKSTNEYFVLKDNKRVCIVTNLKRSEYFPLEQFLCGKFQKYIVSIIFVSPNELDDLDLDAYDLPFSTEDNGAAESGLATKIILFPDSNELEKTKVRIEGFKNAENIMKLSDPKLPFIKDFTGKEEIQTCLVHAASDLYKLDNLAEEIELRKELSSIYFGNGVTILRPIHLLTDDSFIGETIFKKPVVQDIEGNHVNLTFLVCTQKNSLETFRAWDHLSPLLPNNEFKQEVLSVEDYDDLKRICEENLKPHILQEEHHMTSTFLITAAVLTILLIIPQITKRVVYKKLTGHPSERDYERFEKLLDGFACTFSFKPYNREHMWLNFYLMQGNKRKIEAQPDTIFSKIKMRGQQKAAAVRQGSYFYMEDQKFKKAESMLHTCRKADKNTAEFHTMEMMYSVLALEESEYIEKIRERLEPMRKMPGAFTNDAKRVCIGISKYLFGLQYTYLCNKKLSKTYLISALENCRNTPYEYEIKKLLKA